jgi:membrane dipeptidase
MPLIVDAHADLAWNMLTYGRDYTRSAAETRRLEIGSKAVDENGDTLLGWPDYQRGRVCVVFSTLYASPERWKQYEGESQVYKTLAEANRLYHKQLDSYYRLVDSNPDKFRLIRSSPDLNLLLDHWRKVHPNPGPAADDDGHPVGLVVLMEGGDGIRDLAELEEWHELGVRLIGPAWAGTRFCGGTKEPGPLTNEGRALLGAMADFNFIFDLSHMDEQSALEALDIYDGPIVVTHGNCVALLENYTSNRQFSDRLIRGVIERDGVIGLVPYNVFLKSGWTRKSGRRDEVHLDSFIAHIDHVCQLAGDSLHAGIGTDYDGGFGLQSVPPEIDTIADLQNLVSLLLARGYLEKDVENILGENWLRCLKRDLPTS